MISKIFLKASSSSILAAGINFLNTIVIIRLLGANSYNNYITDLAVISIVAIVYELIPSNYSLFKIQDDSSWKQVVATQIFISALLATVVNTIIGYYFDFYSIFTLWFIAYLLVTGLKRYIDLTLQAAGRVDQYFKLEAFTSFLRLLLVLLLYFADYDINQLIWASLVLSTLICQTFWLSYNRIELTYFLSIFKINSYVRLFKNRHLYYPYYLGISLKRITDNSVPILAKYFFRSPEALSAFFLAYRGISFSISQIRIIESIMANRSHIRNLNRLSTQHKLIISLIIQVISLVIAITLQILSGIENVDFKLNFLLSFIVYPIIFSMFGRANALSKYNPHTVNMANLFYLITMGGGVLISILLNANSIILFILILITSQFSALLTYLYLDKRIAK